MEKIIICNYTGYRHNRYDGFNCTWGVLMALGASRTDDFRAAWEGAGEYGVGENTDFRKEVLKNLDCTDATLQEISSLGEGEKYKHTEYWGDYCFVINFKNINKTIIVDFDGKEEFICEF